MCYKRHSITSKVEGAIFTIEIGQVQLYKCIVKSSPFMRKKRKFLEHILKVKIMPLYPILLEIRN